MNEAQRFSYYNLLDYNLIVSSYGTEAHPLTVKMQVQWLHFVIKVL